ncbi:MAG: DUF4231 domain-containing protein [Flavobacteriaceae bacterium]
MTEQEYLSERVDGQIAWYNKKSGINKGYHLKSKALIIIFSALIPFATGYISSERVWLDYGIASLGVLIAILTGLSTLFKFQDKWGDYRLTAEALTHEKYLFQTASGVYNSHEKPFKLFVFRVEKLISKEVTAWSEYTSKDE